MGKNLYVGNLSFKATADDLRELFSAHGTVTSAQVIMDRETGKPRGFGFVEMADGSQAGNRRLNGQEFQGRPLTVNEARPREDRREAAEAEAAAAAADARRRVRRPLLMNRAAGPPARSIQPRPPRPVGVWDQVQALIQSAIAALRSVPRCSFHFTPGIALSHSGIMCTRAFWSPFARTTSGTTCGAWCRRFAQDPARSRRAGDRRQLARRHGTRGRRVGGRRRRDCGSCIARERKGSGPATLGGISGRHSHGYEFLLNMDADFSHDPRHLRGRLVDAMQRADVAIGSRYVPGGGIDGWGLGRHFMSRGINWYARLLLGLRPATTAALIAATGSRSWRRSTWITCGPAVTRSRKKSSIAAAGSAAASRRRRSCSAIGVMGRRRSTGASRPSAFWIIFRLGLENLLGGPRRTSH